MRRILFALVTLALTTAAIPAYGQTTKSAEPFAVGTFAFNGQEGLGLVLRQQLAVELNAANNNLQMEPGVAKMPMPETCCSSSGYTNTASSTDCMRS